MLSWKGKEEGEEYGSKTRITGRKSGKVRRI